MQSTHYISCIRRHWLMDRPALAVYSFSSKRKHALALLGRSICSVQPAAWGVGRRQACLSAGSQKLKCPVLCSQLQRLRAEDGAVLLRHLQPVGRSAGAGHLSLPLLQPVPGGEGPGHRRLPLHGLQHLHAPQRVPHAQVPRPRGLPCLHGCPLRLLPSLQGETSAPGLETCALPCTHGQSCRLEAAVRTALPACASPCTSDVPVRDFPDGMSSVRHCSH